eukprot:2562652-Pleurochrysis_carterae.AAC.3
MLDVHYLGEVNNRDGLPGLHQDQVSCMYCRVTPQYPSDWPVYQNSPNTLYVEVRKPGGVSGFPGASEMALSQRLCPWVRTCDRNWPL